MTNLQKIAILYALILLGAASLNYIPGVVDADGLAFGIFKLDIFDDALHVASALWALIAGLVSRRASAFFLTVFGLLYLGDGIFGYFTGYGYLDLAIFTNPSAGVSHTVPRLLANLPHIALGAFALLCVIRLRSVFGWFGKWLSRLILVVLLVVLALVAPIMWMELGCRSQGGMEPYDALLPEEHHRSEARTLLTYPEWHIVNAYDEYAKVVELAEPHDYRFFSAISGYWNSLCGLKKRANRHGGMTNETKQLVYTIGVSFTAEMVMKALYEETIGRISTLVRGPGKAPLDTLSATQAAEYATFLQQTPWYKYDFNADIAALDAAKTNAPRDIERRFALGTEYWAKSAYAGLIEEAVDRVGPDELTLRMIVNNASAGDLARMEGVIVKSIRGNGIEVETVRYRALTEILTEMARQDMDVVEIAGNDDIMLSVLSNQSRLQGALFSTWRQGYGDYRHLLRVKVPDMMVLLRFLETDDARLEHVYDY